MSVCRVPADLLQVLPLLTERQYVSAVHSRLMDGQPWKLPGLQAVCRLAWALSLRVLSQLPQGCGKVPLFEENPLKDYEFSKIVAI